VFCSDSRFDRTAFEREISDDMVVSFAAVPNYGS